MARIRPPRPPSTTVNSPSIGGRFRSGSLHPRYRDDAALIKIIREFDLGTLALTGTIEQRERSRRYCEARCSHCQQSRWILVDNIMRGATTNCVCQRGLKYGGDPRVETLGRRYDAMIQRCYRDTHASSQNYKGRGIKVHFTSREHFIRWALKRWPRQTFKGLDFDRIDNDGHYAPWNLRLVTRSANSRNKARRR